MVFEKRKFLVALGSKKENLEGKIISMIVYGRWYILLVEKIGGDQGLKFKSSINCCLQANFGKTDHGGLWYKVYGFRL